MKYILYLNPKKMKTMKLKTVLLAWLFATLSLGIVIWLASPIPFWKALAFSAIGFPFIIMLIVGFIAIVTSIK